jgi:tripartite-type tricarboxylate transporter receptor subunit TctC
MSWYKFIACLGACSLLGHLVAAKADEDVGHFYQGKTLHIIVGFSSGGGYDQYGRLLARHYGAYIPGQPNVVVQNMPGAASLKAVQYLDQGAPKDGTTLVTFNPGLITQSLTQSSANMPDFRQVAWIGNISEDVRVCFTWGERNIKTQNDFLAHSQMVFGNTGIGTSAYIDDRILQLLFNIHLRTVQGYPGSADKKIAIENGELDGDCGSWTSMPDDWLLDHKIDIHLRFSRTIPANMPKTIAYAGDILTDNIKKQTLDLLLAGAQIGRPFIAPLSTPPERIHALRRAFDATMNDQNFRAGAETLRLLIGPDRGEDVQKTIEHLYETSDDVKARARMIAGDDK